MSDYGDSVVGFGRVIPRASSVANAVPALRPGEIAVNAADGVLYVGKADGTAGVMPSVVTISQAAYDALSSKTPGTIYVVHGSGTAAAAVYTFPSVPGAPTIVSATQSVGNTTVVFSPPESDGGSPITSYKFYVEGSESAPTSVVGTTATWAGQDGFGDVQVSAVNAVGEGPKSAAVEVVEA